MTIFKNKSKDKYKGKDRVLKSMRVNKDTAIKLDELQAVYIGETGEAIPQNTVLVGIINNFINEIETLANESEDKATQRVLKVIQAGAGKVCKA